MNRIELDIGRLMGVRVCADACKGELTGEGDVQKMALSSSKIGMKEGPLPTKQSC